MPKTSKVKKKTSKIKTKTKNKPQSKVISKSKEIAKAPIKISKNYVPKDSEIYHLNYPYRPGITKEVVDHHREQSDKIIKK